MSGVDAEPRRALPVHLDDNLRDEHLLLDLEILHAINALHRVPRGLSRPPQLAEIVSEDLDCDLGADAGEQVVEPVRDRLTHVDGDARDLVELVADFAEYRLSTALGPGQVDVDLRVSARGEPALPTQARSYPPARHTRVQPAGPPPSLQRT